MIRQGSSIGMPFADYERFPKKIGIPSYGSGDFPIHARSSEGESAVVQ
jgi:hypothetical protein